TTKTEESITRRHARTLHNTERRMMTVVELVNLRVSYEAQTRQRDGEEFHSQLKDAHRDHADIRAEIVALRDRGTILEDAYIELHKDLLRSEARNESLEAHNRSQVARIETIETHITEMEDQFQDTRDHAVSHFEKMKSVFYISSCTVENQVKFANCAMLDATLTWWNGHVRTLGHDAAYAMTWETLKKKLMDKYCPKGEIKKLEIKLWNLKVDKYISVIPDNIHGNVMSARPKTLDEAIELANDLMDQKLRTYAERQNDN
nr:hypothetical protein [Tanacetum cinerariifolium]